MDRPEPHRPSREWSFKLELHVAAPRSTEPPPRAHDGVHRISIPTDLMFAAWRQLFPAERMVVFGARQTRRGICVTSLFDVTEARPSSVHVRACPDRMATGLIDLERTGAHLGLWVHSHPGTGAGATAPSHIDINQDRDFRRHYSDHFIGIIAVRDGWVRLWGDGLTQGRVRVQWIGRGIAPHPGEPHVYKLSI